MSGFMKGGFSMFPVDLLDLEIHLSFRNDPHLLEMELLHYEIDCPTQPFERMDHDQVSNYSNSVSQLVSLLRSGRAS